MKTTIFKVKIDGIPKNYTYLEFGERLQYQQIIQNFKESSQTCWVNQTCLLSNKAWNKFISDVKPKQYYAVFHDNRGEYYDDTFQVWYKV